MSTKERRQKDSTGILRFFRMNYNSLILVFLSSINLSSWYDAYYFSCDPNSSLSPKITTGDLIDGTLEPIGKLEIWSQKVDFLLIDKNKLDPDKKIHLNSNLCMMLQHRVVKSLFRTYFRFHLLE